MAKQLSRAKRRDLVTKSLCETAAEAHSIADFLEDKKNQTLAGFRAVKARIDILSVDYEDLSDLKDEIESWRDSIPENLQGGDKFSTLDETANTLESVVSELESTEVPALELSEKDEDVNLETVRAGVEDLAESLNQFAAALEEGASEADNTEFPGMMG